MTNKTKQPQPETAVTGESISESQANVVAMRPSKGKRQSIWDSEEVGATETAIAKSQLLSEVRQRLAETQDALRDSQKSDAEREEAASKVALRLYQARRDKMLTADEVTTLLGETFGFKSKPDGTPSRTPEKFGEYIRKRVVRCTNAFEYINDGDGGRFFEGLPTDEIQSVVNALHDGNRALFTAYEDFSKIRSNNSERVDMAFNPKSIAKIVEKLSENVDASAKLLLDNSALRDSYKSLRDLIELVGERAGELAAEAA